MSQTALFLNRKQNKMQDPNLPPGVSQQMIDNYYSNGPDEDGLEFHIDKVTIYPDEIEVEVEWTKDDDNWIWYNREDCEEVSEVYNKTTCFYLPLECKDFTHDQLHAYIENNENPY